jgi:hypothetical protein
MKKKYLRRWRTSLVTFATVSLLVVGTVVLPTVFAKIGVNLDQYQNGNPLGTNAGWANGSINASNSVYREGQSIPFRYFITGVTAGSSHHFTIQMEYKKGGNAAYDFLTSFNRSFAAGLECSTITTAVPADCGAGGFFTAAFPDPGSGALTGYLPFVPNVAAGQRQLQFYNATNVSFGTYFFTGTASDPELNLLVSFDAVSNGSVGMYWGGHLARANDWNGVGASSISGAPFHMRGINLDDAGKTNQDRSVQPGAVLPEAGCGISPAGAVCSGSDHTYSSPGTAVGATYDWSITGNGVFVIPDGGGGTTTTTANQSTTTVTVRAGAAGSYTLNLTTDGSGFELSTCSLTVTVNAIPVASITSDNTSCGSSPSLTAHVVGGDVAGDSYAWTASNGGAIPSGQASSQTITPTAPGTYSVVITRSGCASAQVSGTLCFTPVFTVSP